MTGSSTKPAGALYVVATPIGNLADITLRAIDILRSVDVVAAEDTRATRVLLDRHGIRAHLESYHARNAARKGPALLERLRAGEAIALVTDAGTPGVSDPGGDLVLAWTAEDGRVVPIPGASALLAAVSATAIAGPRWSFEGFLPRSGRERRERLARVAGDVRGTILFESANRLAATLGDLAAVAGGDRHGAVCRELTKIHEEIVEGSLAELATAARSGELTLRGEIVIVVGAVFDAAGAERERRAGALDASRAEVERLVAAGMARSDAAKRVAAASGIPRRRLYGLASTRAER